MVHVAIIMDGNRRWAASRGLPLADGYKAGIDALERAAAGAIEAGVTVLTVFGFSTENWNRARSEVELLMSLCAWFARSKREDLRRRGIRVNVVGDMTAFTFPARAAIGQLVRATSGNRRLTLNLALNYSGRAEIVQAVRRIASDAAARRLNPDTIDDAVLRERLYAPGMPDPDLLIRTGGDVRISNFLLYQIAYTELVWLPVPWPEFTASHLREAVDSFGARNRRFGA